MPKTIGEFINDLTQKAGIPADDADLKSLLASPELANIKVPDTLATAIDSGLLSIEAAKNNHPDIKKKYFADAYDGIDKQLLKLIENDTFDAADFEEIKAEKSTSKKAELIVSKLKALKKADKGANAEEWNKKIADANEAARLAKEEVAKVTATYEGKIKGIYKNAALNVKFGTYKTIYDELDPTIKLATMESLINKALQDKNAELQSDEVGNLKLVGKDGSNVFGDNHVQLTPQSFFDKTFAPILKVSGPIKPVAPNGQHPQAPAKVDEKAEATVNQISSHNAAVMEAFSKPQAALV